MKNQDIRSRLGGALLCLGLGVSATTRAQDAEALEPPRSINAPAAPGAVAAPAVVAPHTGAPDAAAPAPQPTPQPESPSSAAVATPATRPQAPQVGATVLPPVTVAQAAESPRQISPATRPAQPPESWRPGPFSVGFMAGGVHRVDDGYREFAEGSVWGQGGLFVAYDAALGQWLRLGGQLQWSLSFVDEDGQAGAPDRSLYEHRAVASALLSAVALPQLWPHVRLGAGSSMSKVRYAPQQGLFLIDQWRVVPLLDLALGATYHVPLRRAARTLGLALGVRLELGYVIAGARQLSQDKGGRFGVKTALGPLGTLRPSGAYLRAALLVRF